MIFTFNFIYIYAQIETLIRIIAQVFLNSHHTKVVSPCQGAGISLSQSVQITPVQSLQPEYKEYVKLRTFWKLIQIKECREKISPIGREKLERTVFFHPGMETKLGNFSKLFSRESVLSNLCLKLFGTNCKAKVYIIQGYFYNFTIYNVIIILLLVGTRPLA